MGVGASTLNPATVSFIDFDQFKKYGSIPRNPECEKMCVDMSSINRSKALVVFVSHSWVSVGGETYPDRKDGQKYRLIVDGITELIKENFPKCSKCYLWIDYSCHNQGKSDNPHPSSVLEQLDVIVGFCDCLFTPLLGRLEGELSYTAKYSKLPLESWNNPGSGFINRAWCRTEMFYGCNISNFADSNSRLEKLQNRLRHFAEIGKRPHFVYAATGNEEEKLLLAPLLQNALLKELTPEYGQSSVDSDHVRIMELTSKLKKHIERNNEGYFGDVVNKKMHGLGLLRFASGALYQGSFVQGKKHGQGTFVYATGNVYAGEWMEDMKHGKGELRFINGNTFRGQFKLDKKSGEGAFTWKTGEKYEGNWVNDLKHGKGCMKFNDGSEYTGDYFEDQIEGEGGMKYPNGDVYSGDFVEGQRYGHGEMKFHDGSMYEGQFINGVMQGRGTFISEDQKNIYEGNFYNNERNGHGSCQYEDGEYIGFWLGGLRHGQGTFTSVSNGDKYVGDWLNDLKHGNGIYKSKGGVYEGQYQCGQLHGKGMFTYPNGDVYEGVWLHDKKQGQGTYTYANGKKWIAMWHGDELVEKVAA